MRPGSRAVPALLILALALRLLPILLTRASQIVPDWPVPMDRDGIGYASYAESLWEGFGYVESTGDRSHRAPGYPLLILFSFLLGGGRQFLVLRFLQALIGTAACWVLYRLARSAWGERAAFWTLLGSALYVPFLFYVPQVLNSTLYLALVACLLASLVWASRGEDLGRAGVPGIFLGLAALTAGTVLGAAPALAAWLAWSRRREGWRKALASAGLMGLLTLTVLAPWAVRNWKVQGSFILLDTNSGGVLFLGNNNYPYWQSGGGPDALDQVRRSTDYDRLDEAGKDRLLRSLALGWIREDPVRFLKVWASKMAHAWSPFPSRKPWKMTAASLGTYGVALALGLWGAWKAFRERDGIGGLLVLYLLAVSATHCVFVIAQRHRVPLMDPALILLGAYALGFRKAVQ